MAEETQHDEVDPLGPDVRWASLLPVIVYMLAVGGLLTLATWQDWSWAYVLGLVLTAGWVAGFVVAKNTRAGCRKQPAELGVVARLADRDERVPALDHVVRPCPDHRLGLAEDGDDRDP